MSRSTAPSLVRITRPAVERPLHPDDELRVAQSMTVSDLSGIISYAVGYLAGRAQHDGLLADMLDDLKAQRAAALARLKAAEATHREWLFRPVTVFHPGAEDAESFDVTPCSCPSATMAEIDRIFSLDEEIARA